MAGHALVGLSHERNRVVPGSALCYAWSSRHDLYVKAFPIAMVNSCVGATKSVVLPNNTRIHEPNHKYVRPLRYSTSESMQDHIIGIRSMQVSDSGHLGGSATATPMVNLENAHFYP